MPDGKKENITIFTIGYQKISAEYFFTKLQDAGVRKIVDIRLYNNTQYDGFAKKNTLEYFLKVIGIGYTHNLEFAPTKEILADWKDSKKTEKDWEKYKRRFLPLIQERGIENLITPEEMNNACLLCFESIRKVNHCHRRLAAEYLREKWDNVEIRHL